MDSAENSNGGWDRNEKTGFPSLSRANRERDEMARYWICMGAAWNAL
jgi:hypothetical protein